MKVLSVSSAKADRGGIARNVVRCQKPVIVRIPTGFIQIAPCKLPEVVPAFPSGSLGLLPRKVDLHNFARAVL